MKALPHTEASKALASTSTDKQPVTASTVFAGIGDVLIAFPAGPTRSDDDMDRLVEIYAEIVSEFDLAVVAHTLKQLLRHNPRNPFRPSPQDVYEACNATISGWRKATREKYLEGRDRPTKVPSHLERAYLRQLLESALYDISRERDPRHYLATMRDDQFARIPTEAFPEGGYEVVLAARKKFDEECASRRAELASE